MTDRQNREWLINLLACPQCGGYHLVDKCGQLECLDCMQVYSILNGIPIFRINPQDTQVIPSDHASNQLSDEVINWLKGLNGYSLNIGAGSTKTKISHCVELEYSIHRNTDIVSDAHCLPFKDEVFDAVVSFNTFEHLHNPFSAAKEIFRVLKPGGKLILRTAFLQPLHEEPVHYYNATKYGVLNWFSELDIETCQVSENFNPAFTLAWLSTDILASVKQVFGQKVSEKLSKTTLDSWSKIWLNTSDRSGFLWDTLANLPQFMQERFSAGFEIKATKPVKQLSNQSQVSNHLNPNLLEQSQFQLQHIQTELKQLQTQLQQTQAELKRSQATIALMRTSKFWKLRTKWFNLQKFIGLPINP